MNSPIIGKDNTNLIDNNCRITYNQNDSKYNPIGEIYELDKIEDNHFKSLALKKKNFYDDEYYIGKKFKSMVSAMRSNQIIKKDLQFKFENDKTIKKSKYYDNKLRYEVIKSRSDITFKKDYLMIKTKHYDKNHDDYFKSICEKKNNKSYDDLLLEITNKNLKKINKIEYFTNPNTHKFYFKNSVNDELKINITNNYDHNYIHSSSTQLHYNDSFTLRNLYKDKNNIRVNYFNNKLRKLHSLDDIYNSNNQYIHKRCGTYNKNKYDTISNRINQSSNTIQTTENLNNNKKKVSFNKNVVVVLIANWKKETKKMTYNGDDNCCECFENCNIF